MAQWRTDEYDFKRPHNVHLYEMMMLADQYGNPTVGANPTGSAVDAFGRARITEPFTLFDSFNRYSINENFESELTGESSTVTFDINTSSVLLNIDDQSGSKVIRETKRVFAYQPGKSLQIINSFVFDAVKENLTQRVGYYNDFNGIYFENDGVANKFVVRSNVTGSVINNQIAQSQWNLDKLDGTGPSKKILDVSKAQIMFADIEWLGVGSVRCGFVLDGQFILCHAFHHANLIDSVYMTTACLPIRYEIENVAANTSSNSTLTQVCSTVISEGGYELQGDSRTLSLEPNSPRSLATAGTYYPVISIRLDPDKLDSIAVIRDISALGVDIGNYKLKLIKDASIVGGVWVNTSNNSSVQYNSNTSATLSGGTDLFSDYFSSTAQSKGTINIGPDIFKYQLERLGLAGGPLTMTLAITAGTNTKSVLGGISWQEIT